MINAYEMEHTLLNDYLLKRIARLLSHESDKHLIALVAYNLYLYYKKIGNEKLSHEYRTIAEKTCKHNRTVEHHLRGTKDTNTPTSVMEDVIDALDLEMTPEDLRESITINNPVDTRILEVSVVNTDGELAKKITDKVVEVSSEYIGDKMEVVPPKIIEKGKIPTVQTSPSMTKNILIGFLAGIVLCGGIICVLTVMDDTIKSEDDVEKYLGVPVLASVPDRKDYINKNRRKK